MNIVAAKLEQLGMKETNDMLIEFVLKSLPARFDHFKLNIVYKSISGVLKISIHFVLKKNFD